MARYLDPKNDLPFKKIFGEHKHLLISFLNALLPLQKGQDIVDIEYLTPEQVPRAPLSKNSIVDVKCIDNRRRRFIVEMQMAWSKMFANRLVFNASKAYVQQFDKEKHKDKMPSFAFAHPVYSLAIVNGKLPNEDPASSARWYHHFQIAERGNPNRVMEGLEFVVVELPKFQPETWSQADKRMAVLWLRFLKEIEASEAVPEELLAEDEIKQAISICEVGAFTQEELAYYDKYLEYAMWEAGCGELEESVVERDKIIDAERKANAEKDKALAAERRANAEKDAEIARLLERISQQQR